MPEARIGEYFEQAITQVRCELIPQLQAQPLTAEEVAGYRHREYVDGWRIQAEFSVGIRQLDLLFKKSFPFSAPEIALVNPPPILTYPHIEADGKLCLLPDSASINYRLPIEVTRHVISKAFALLAECYAGVNQEDFRQEFLSYWNRNLKNGASSFLSLLNPSPPSRLVRIWRGKYLNVVGEGEDDLVINNWLKNRFGSKKNFDTEAAAFIWLDQPLLPDEYPKTSNDLLKLSKNSSRHAIELLDKLIAKNPHQAIIIFGMNSYNGPCLAGITAYKPKQKQFNKAAASSLNNGFRVGKTPSNIISKRFWQSPTPVLHSAVSRVDASWVHGRGKDSRQEKLSSATVVLIGCGSVGSHVAGMLAQAGIGHLILLDPETLTWANVGRHRLGAKYVEQYKAGGLAKELQENYPHLKIEFRNVSLEDALHKEPALFLNAQLILSVTGNWSAKSALNAWHQTHHQQVPILHGWTEAHACAGHAVLIANEGGCLECGFNSLGVPQFKVTDWSGKTTELQEPACGAVFQPYGPVELNQTNALIAEMALDVVLGKINSSTHHVWACRETFLLDYGGKWSDKWIESPAFKTEGGYMVSRSWEKNSECFQCNTTKTFNATLSNW